MNRSNPASTVFVTKFPPKTTVETKTRLRLFISQQTTTLHSPKMMTAPPSDHIFSAQMMGFIHAMKTGNPTLDMIFAFVVPLVVARTMALMKNGMELLLRKRPKVSKHCSRTITHRSTLIGGNVRSAESNTYNLHLIKAIRFYMNKMIQIDMDHADVDLTSIDTPEQTSHSRRAQSQNRKNNGTLDMLQNARVVETPKDGEWLEVGRFGPQGGCVVSLCYHDSLSSQQRNRGEPRGDNNNNDSSGGTPQSSGSVRTVEVQIRSANRSAIHDFLKTVYNWYLKELQDSQNEERFMFDVECSSNNIIYRKYKLGEEKTFDTLFCKSCHAILRTVDQFLTKTGKYAIKGFPHKLGLLLSGPPGTGKTTFIKALAAYTKRHIVYIPLSRIHTNQQLMNVFFRKTYMIDNEPHYIDFEDVIFVLEDVDAASEVVRKRQKQKSRAAETSTLSPTAAISPPVNPNASTGPRHFQLDKLNLSGLLNVLDGVVETPGRLVIMTTNHPEDLDPALIRPGRVDKHLVLSYMATVDVVAMLEHYYEQPLSLEAKADICTLIDTEGLKITPASLERMILEIDESVEALIQALKVLKEDDELKSENSIDERTTAPSDDSSYSDGLPVAFNNLQEYRFFE